MRSLIFVLLFLMSGFVFAAQIDINSASAEDIATELNGVGPSRAAAIVKFRQENGPFKSFDDLTQVKGIGQKTIEANKEKIKFASDK